MNPLKSEGRCRREVHHPAGARLELPMQPEMLCDYDILLWRQANLQWCDRRDPILTESKQLTRDNDVPGSTRNSTLNQKDHTQFVDLFYRSL